MLWRWLLTERMLHPDLWSNSGQGDSMYNCETYPKLLRDALLGCTVIHVYVSPTHTPIKKEQLRLASFLRVGWRARYLTALGCPRLWWNPLQDAHTLLDVVCLPSLAPSWCSEGCFQIPAPLGLVKILYQWPSFSVGVTFASALLSLPDLAHLQRQVTMAIRIQPNQIWLLYLIKCSLKPKSHHSYRAILFSGHVFLCLPPSLCPVCPLPRLASLLPDLGCHGKYLGSRRWEDGRGWLRQMSTCHSKVTFTAPIRQH